MDLKLFNLKKISILLNSIMAYGWISLNATTISLTNNQVENIENSINVNSSKDALGVEVYLLEKSSILKNNTTIKSTILSTNNNIYSSGIYFDSHGGSIGMTDDSQLINDKEIIVSSTGNTEVYSDAVNINYIGNNSKVINHGSISAISIGEEDANAVGIALNSINNDASVTNNNIINVKAEAPIWGKSIGILISDANDEDYYNCSTGESCMNEKTSIFNNGTIDASIISKIGETFGILHYGEMIDESKIVNSSTGIINSIAEYDKVGVGLNSEEFAQSFGIDVRSMKNKSSIINQGVIFVDSKNIADKATSYNFGIITASMMDEASIVNSGKIEALVNGQLDSRASSIFNYYAESSALITNEESGKLLGNIVLLADKNKKDNGTITLNNKGFISIPYNANKNSIILNDDEGRVDSIRPYIPNLINSGTIEIGAYKNSSGNIENTQILTKNATFQKGSKMQVSVLNGSKVFNMGDTLAEVIKSTNKLTVDELTLNQTKLVDNSAILDFEYKIINDNQIDLVVSKINKIGDVISENNQNMINNNTIADILDSFRNNPLFENIISKIDAMESTGNISKAISSIVPSSATTLLNTSSQITSSILDVVSSRFGNIKMGSNSGDEMIIDENRLWVKTFGSIGRQKDTDSISGFDLKTYGFGIGYDKEDEDINQILGLSAFYTKANLKTNNINHKNDLDVYSIVGYGTTLLWDEKTSLYYQILHSWQVNNSQRELFTNEIAESQFVSKTISADLKIGHRIDLNEEIAIEPNLGINYSHFSNPAYKEKGGGVLNINSNKFTSSKVVGKIGTDLEYTVNKNSKLKASVSAGYNFKKSNRTVISSFENLPDSTFNLEGIDNGRWEYKAGIGYELNLNERNTIDISYNYLGEGSKYQNNTVTINYSYKF